MTTIAWLVACVFMFMWGVKTGENLMLTPLIKTLRQLYPDDPSTRTKIMCKLLAVRRGIDDPR